MSIREKIKNKIKSRKGMSIGEVLASVLIMLLATSVLTTTVTLANSKYLRTLSRSEANVLASTLENLMTNELAYTNEIHTNGNTVTKFQSQDYNKISSLSMFAAVDGKMVITYPDASGNVKLLGDGSYPNGLTVSDPSITYTYNETAKTGTFTITFSISRKNETILTRTFDVISVNNTKPTTLSGT